MKPASNSQLRLLVNWFSALKPEATTALASVDAIFAANRAAPWKVFQGLGLVLADAAFRQQSRHLLLVTPLTYRMRRQLELTQRLFPDVQVFQRSRREVLTRFFQLVKGRLLVAHGLGQDQQALQQAVELEGIQEWPLPFPGFDTWRCEQAEDRRRSNTLASCYHRLWPRPPRPKCAVSDALKAFAVAQKHAGDLAGLQALARQQMDMRVKRLSRHPSEASQRGDRAARLRAVAKARRLYCKPACRPSRPRRSCSMPKRPARPSRRARRCSRTRRQGREKPK